MKYIVSISGGKDSTACLLYALNSFSKDDVIPVFCDTEWEHKYTYEYLEYLEKKLNISIIRLKSLGFVELSKKKKFMPNRVMRYCTLELKIKPFNKYLYENFIIKNIDFIVIKGVRREESQARKNTPVFSETKGIYNRKSFIVKSLYPIVDWTTKEVFEYLIQNNIKLNKLYLKGFSRVGCYPCIYATKWELENLEDEYIKRIRKLENQVSNILGKNVTFFSPDRDKFLKRNQKKLFKEFEDAII